MKNHSLEQLIEGFISNKPMRVGNYFVEGNSLVCKKLTERTLVFSDDDKIRSQQVRQAERVIRSGAAFVIGRWGAKSLEEIVTKEYDKMEVRYLGRELIATKILHNGQEIALGNSSLLSLANEEFVKASSRSRRNGRVSIETDIQRELAKHIPMIPFNVFAEAGLDLTKIQIIERGPNETVVRVDKEQKDDKVVEHKTQVHYTGATLFTIDGKYYLFDLDRRELEFGILNPFLVELAGQVKSISEAYESLKPVEVKNAMECGLDVLRQGEWFFIPVSQLEAKRLSKHEPKSLTLQAGNNRPNYAQGIQMYNGNVIDDQRSLRGSISEAKNIAEKSDYFITGKVIHSGREHKELQLKGWYRAVPNTATQSWTIRGDVD